MHSFLNADRVTPRKVGHQFFQNFRFLDENILSICTGMRYVVVSGHCLCLCLASCRLQFLFPHSFCFLIVSVIYFVSLFFIKFFYICNIFGFFYVFFWNFCSSFFLKYSFLLDTRLFLIQTFCYVWAIFISILFLSVYFFSCPDLCVFNR